MDLAIGLISLRGAFARADAQYRVAALMRKSAPSAGAALESLDAVRKMATAAAQTATSAIEDMLQKLDVYA